jgi:hypothetical protein
LLGGSPVLVSTSLRLTFALMTNDGLMALLTVDNGQKNVIDVLHSLLPSIEAGVLTALQL